MDDKKEEEHYFEIIKEYGELKRDIKKFVCHCCGDECALSSIAITRHVRRCELLHSLHKIIYNLKNDLIRVNAKKVLPFTPIVVYNKTNIDRDALNAMTCPPDLLKEHGQYDNGFQCGCGTQVGTQTVDIIEHILRCRRYPIDSKLAIMDKWREMDQVALKYVKIHAQRRLEPSKPTVLQMNRPVLGEKREALGDRHGKIAKMDDMTVQSKEDALRISENQLERVKTVKHILRMILDAPGEKQTDVLEFLKALL